MTATVTTRSASERRALADGVRELAHDLGKHLPRTARNVSGEVPRELLPLLEKDLYALDGERPASAVLAAHRRALAGLEDARLDLMEALLAEADALAPSLGRDPLAAARAVAIATRVAALALALERDVLRALAGPGEPR